MEKIILSNWVKSFFKWSWLILLVTVLSAFIVNRVVDTKIEKIYRASVQVIVPISATDNENQTVANEISTNLMKIPTYSELIKSSDVLDELSKQLDAEGISLDSEELSEIIKLVHTTDSQVFSLVVDYSDPETAVIIADHLFTIFAEQATNLLAVNNITAVTSARLESEPITPNVPKLTIVGAVFGFLLSLMIIIISEYLLNLSRKKKEFILVELHELGNLPKKSMFDYLKREKHKGDESDGKVKGS